MSRERSSHANRSTGSLSSLSQTNRDRRAPHSYRKGACAIEASHDSINSSLPRRVVRIPGRLPAVLETPSRRSSSPEPPQERQSKVTIYLNGARVDAPFSMERTFDSSPARSSPNKNAPKPVNFYYSAPSARSVYLVGDFNRWHPTSTPMQRRPDGWWFGQVELAQGHHRYRFLVDGRPVLDPRATGVALNELNEEVSLVAVS